MRPASICCELLERQPEGWYKGRDPQPGALEYPSLHQSVRGDIKLLIDIRQYIDKTQYMDKIGVVTGATRNLGFFLAQGLAQRLRARDTVYLTGRDASRVAESVGRVSAATASVQGEMLDV